MRTLLLLGLTACTGTSSAADPDAALLGVPCADFEADPTYVVVVPDVAVTISLQGINWHRFESPFDPNDRPVAGFVGGKCGEGCVESGPIAEVGPETFQIRGVMWSGERGKAVYLAPIEAGRCQWARAQ
jgi:hypothetical protein